MAQIYTNFSEYTSGVAPSDWTERWTTDINAIVTDDAGATGGKVLRITTTSASDNAITWDDADGSTDVDVISRTKIFSYGSNVTNVVGALARASGAFAARTGYAFGVNNEGGVRNLYVFKFAAGVFSLISGPTNVSSTVDTTNMDLMSRFCVVGTGATVYIKVKLWKASGAEPATWTKEDTDTTASRIVTSGWVGFMANHQSDFNRDIDTFFVDTAVTSQSVPLATTTLATFAPDLNIVLCPEETATLATFAPFASAFEAPSNVTSTLSTFAPSWSESFQAPLLTLTATPYTITYYETHTLTGDSYSLIPVGLGSVDMEIGNLSGLTVVPNTVGLGHLETTNSSRAANIYAPVPSVNASGSFEIPLRGAV